MTSSRCNFSGTMFFATGSVRQGSTTCLCVASKKHLYLYELNRTKGRHRKIKDLPLNISIQWMAVSDGRLIIGYPSGFSIIDILSNNAQMQSKIKKFLFFSFNSAILFLYQPTLFLHSSLLINFYLCPSTLISVNLYTARLYPHPYTPVCSHLHQSSWLVLAVPSITIYSYSRQCIPSSAAICIHFCHIPSSSPIYRTCN